MRGKLDDNRAMFSYEEDPYDIDKDWRRPDQGLTPLNCKRRTTDMSWLVLFIGCMCFLASSVLYAAVRGSLAEYFGFTDYSGHICGVSESVVGEPYVYMCRDSGSGLDEDHPICVTGCPRSADSKTFCPGGVGGASRSVNDYPTKPYAGKLCMPINRALKDILTAKISGTPGTKFFLIVAEILEDIWPLAISAVVAVLLGFVHLFLLRRFGMCFVWMGFLAMTGVPLLLGIKLISASYTGSLDDVVIFGDEQGAYVAGLLMCSFSLVLSCLVLCSYQDLLLARMTTKAAVECILDTLGLLVEPFIALAIRVFMFVNLTLGFLLLSSSEGWQWEGFAFSGPLPLFMVLYIVAALWVLQVCSALSQYIAAFVTEEWFFATYNAVVFSKDVDPAVMRKAYYSGLRYHLGTLACGACVLPLVRGPRALLGFVAQASQRMDNAVGRFINRCCICCIEFYYRRLECLNRSAYFDVALNSLPLQPAAVHALAVLSDDATDVLSMHGAAWLIELGGAGGVTAVCVGLTHLMCKHFPPFSDPASPFNVANPILIDLVTAVICYPIAAMFLAVVVHVSDCILFCCAVERARNPVRSLLEDAGTGLLSRFNVCASERRGMSWNDDVNHLPNTRALLSMVTRDRSEQQYPSEKSGSWCSSRDQ